MQELPLIGFKTYIFSLQCHLLQTLQICPPREGKYLPQLNSFPLSLWRRTQFHKEGQMTMPGKLSRIQKYV